MKSKGVAKGFGGKRWRTPLLPGLNKFSLSKTESISIWYYAKSFQCYARHVTNKSIYHLSTDLLWDNHQSRFSQSHFRAHSPTKFESIVFFKRDPPLLMPSWTCNWPNLPPKRLYIKIFFFFFLLVYSVFIIQ